MHTARFDSRFSDPAASATPWPDAVKVLQAAELYWLTTVRGDGRPHVTPLIAVWRDGAMHFSTGLGEQKAHNLEANASVALTTGTNTWAQGMDVVVEGTAARVKGRETLQGLAEEFEAKYGADWHFEVDEESFLHGPGAAAVFRIEAAKVFAFAKEPHGQTAFRFAGGA
jgi:nitroimidazol reductase NimA-like FMN-containing flavoprotein (pyridoxamine 5'-phosphate oxidase superfamily)